MLAQRDRFTPMNDQKPEDPDRIAAVIDRNLRLVYADLAREDLPDRFKDLLAVLKAQDAGRDATE